MIDRTKPSAKRLWGEPKPESRPEPCLIQKAWEREQLKPLALRRTAFYISCRCKRCNPYTF